jgi:hypothetical protein
VAKAAKTKNNAERELMMQGFYWATVRYYHYSNGVIDTNRIETYQGLVKEDEGTSIISCHRKGARTRFLSTILTTKARLISIEKMEIA